MNKRRDMGNGGVVSVFDLQELGEGPLSLVPVNQPKIKRTTTLHPALLCSWQVVVGTALWLGRATCDWNK